MLEATVFFVSIDRAKRDVMCAKGWVGLGEAVPSHFSGFFVSEGTRLLDQQR